MILNPKIIRQLAVLGCFLSFLLSAPPYLLALSRRDKAISAALEDFQKSTPKEDLKEDMSRVPDYLLSEDDLLDITVWRYLQPLKKEGKGGVGEYLINTGDALEISVWQWPDLLKDVIVRPDGKISYPLVGDIQAVGLTITQLQDTLTEKLKDYIKSPQVSVMVKQFGASVYGAGYTGKIVDLPFVKIDDLSGEQLVRPDGKITFPILGDVSVQGLTVAQLSKELAKKISAFVKNAEVTISVKQFGGRKIIVLGEVETPGVYKPSGEVTLMEAVALAGGYTRDAILKNVVVVRGSMDKPEAKVFNLLAVIKKANLKQNVMVHGGDIVYVPRSHLSNLNYFLEQFISPLVTASSTVTPIRALRVGTGIPGK